MKLAFQFCMNNFVVDPQISQRTAAKLKQQQKQPRKAHINKRQRSAELSHRPDMAVDLSQGKGKTKSMIYSRQEL